MSEQEEMMDLLLEVGVYLLNRRKREELAFKLREDGISADDVRALQHYIGPCTEEPGKAQTLMAFYLRDEANRKDIMADLRKRAARLVQLQPNDYGAALRRQNMAAVAAFDLAYEDWRRKKEAGLLPELERRQMPWQKCSRSDTASPKNNWKLLTGASG